MTFESLNEEQLKALNINDGPVLILAGAGSGKTRVLTSKIAHLVLDCNIDPTSILAITFTNKAAKEMKNRVFKYLGSKAYDIWISTFHSFGLLIIKENYKELGYKENFTILDSDDSLTVIKKVMKDLGLDTKIYNPKAIRNAISSSKSELIDSYEYERYTNSEFTRIVYEVYKKYENKLLLSNSLDFDDLLLLPIKLFRKNPKILDNYQERYKYILIDEYQDTNEAQYMMTKLISSKYNNICVVGDDSQAIYSWRGANYKNILNFEKDHKNAKIILLEQNYRSTKTILNAANEVIKNNTLRKDKNLWTSNPIGDKINYYRASDEKDEAKYVVNKINELIEKGYSKDTIAVLYRTNAQSRNIEEALLGKNIPYKVIGSFYFYNRKEIKDLISYLKLIYNTSDDTSLIRIINVPKRGIGLATIDKLSKEASENNTSMYDSIKGKKELEFKELIEYFKSMKDSLSLTELVSEILDKTGMKKELESDNDIESEIRLENLEEFKSITKSFENEVGIISLEDFLNEISLVSDVSEYKNSTDLITLMTMHSAKGLEYDNVFIIGMEEGIFPHSNSFCDQSELEEERRLFYVALTRAKKNLWITNARQRVLYGITSCNNPSRFINEISSEYINKDGFTLNVNSKEINMPIDLNQNVIYNVGDKVIHDEFGEGIVISVDKSIVQIAFKHPYGIKNILKGHKSIRKVK